MSEPLWLTEARSRIGQREFAVGSNPFIASLWINAVAVWQALGADDSGAPWCGSFIDHCMRTAGQKPPPHSYRARAWLEWGQSIVAPCVGCVVVFERTGGGHVGFVVGRDANHNLMVLGGNQKDAVSIAPFARPRVLGYRWKKGETPTLARLPLLNSDGRLSMNEA